MNAGQHSLVRQFLSGLTNHRDDEWGADRLRFARDVIAAVRTAVGPARVVGLRLSGDELAPWAGITPEMAPDIAAALVAEGVDYVVVVRGAIFSAEQTRPDFHQPAGFNAELAAAVAGAIDVPVILQGSVVDAGAGRVGAAVDGPVRRGRDDPGADRRPRSRRQAARRRARTGSGRAPAATRRARCATCATRS